MKLFHQKITWVIILVILGVVSITVVAIADPEVTWPWSSEPGSVEPRVKEPAVDSAQPDENGYTGPLPEAQKIEMPPSSDYEIELQPDWEEFQREPQPDDNLDGQSMTEGDLRWSTLFYYDHVAGAVLRPRDSSIEWAPDSSGGCVYLSSGNTNTILNLHLDIPDGVRIDYLRIYYYDASVSDSIAWVTRYDNAGGYDDVAYVFSSGDTGYGTQLSSEILHVVDNVNYSYVLNWRPNVTGSSMALCGLRVAYRLP